MSNIVNFEKEKDTKDVKSIYEYTKKVCSKLGKEEMSYKEVAEFYEYNKSFYEEVIEDKSHSYKLWCKDLLEHEIGFN